jgi:phospholipase C
VPPKAVPPGDGHAEFSFDRLGLRVPAVLVSPWVKKGVIDTKFEHCSVLKYLIEKWHLEPLNKRVDSCNSIAEAIQQFDVPRDTIDSVPLPPMELAAAPLTADAREPIEPLNENQKALLEFSKYLEQKAAAEGGPLPLRAGHGLETDAEAAKRRMEDFIAVKKAQAMRAGK